MLLIQLDDEVNSVMGIVVLVVFDEGWHLLSLDDLFEFVFEILGPSSDRQFGNLNFRIAALMNDPTELVAIGSRSLDLTFETSEPRLHWLPVFAFHPPLQVLNDVLWIVVRN